MWRLVLTTIVNLKAGSTSCRFCFKSSDRATSRLGSIGVGFDLSHRFEFAAM
jgi:hypothetical protein